MERTLSAEIVGVCADLTKIEKLAGSWRRESFEERIILWKRPFLSEKPLREVLKQYQWRKQRNPSKISKI